MNVNSPLNLMLIIKFTQDKACLKPNAAQKNEKHAGKKRSKVEKDFNKALVKKRLLRKSSFICYARFFGDF